MNRLRCIFAATLSAMVLGACGGSGAFSPAASGGATVGANLYVASSRNSTVTLYALGSKSVIRTISQGLAAPANLAVDGSGNLFVANRAGDTITIYARGSNQLLRTISEGISSPNGLAFDRSGNLYVANETGNSVTVYAPNSTKTIAAAWVARSLAAGGGGRTF